MRKALMKLAASGLCLCLLFSFIPMCASADSAIDKVLCTTSSTPVAQMDSRDIYANTSTSGCYIESYVWYDTSSGNVVHQLFGTGNVQVEISLRANEGWYFSENVAVYLNNSSAEYYIGEGGSTLTLTRTYAPELWAPSVIKNPGSETVDEGDFASFVSTATVTAEYHWYLYDPESGKSYPSEDVGELFPGVTIGGDWESKFNLYNIPAAMDGWQVYCVFSGPGGETASAKANINVNYETPPPAATPAPTPEPSAESEAAEEADEESEPESSAAPDHAHSFSSSWKTSEALHWRECECGAKTGESVHSLTWTVEREATKRESGLSVGECSTCGYRAERELAYDNANSVLRYIVLGLGGLVLLTIIVLVIDSIAASRRRRRRRRRR